MLLARHEIEHARCQALVLGAEEEGIPGSEGHFGIGVRASGLHDEWPSTGQRRETLVDVDMRAHVSHCVVIETGAAHRLETDVEADRLHQVQGAARVGAQADDVARVGRDLRLDEHDVEHERLL